MNRRSLLIDLSLGSMQMRIVAKLVRGNLNLIVHVSNFSQVFYGLLLLNFRHSFGVFDLSLIHLVHFLPFRNLRNLRLSLRVRCFLT